MDDVLVSARAVLAATPSRWEALMPFLIEGCGPWQDFFIDHVAHDHG